MPHERKRTITIFVTEKCNLRCTYCITSPESLAKSLGARSISLEFAKAGIDDFFFKRAGLFGVGNNKLRFYGVGEPTTRMDLVSDIEEYARSVKEDLSVEMQTNGVFDCSVTKWITDHISELWVSIDGPPAIQDKNRPMKDGRPTSKIVERNIEYIMDHGVFVGARATITPENVTKQIEMIDYFGSLGIEWVYAEPVFHPITKEGFGCGSSITQVNLDTFLEKFVEAYFYAKERGMNYGNFFIMNFDEKCNFACRACLPMPQLTADGYVSSCDLAFSGGTPLQELIFGRWDKKEKRIIYDKDEINRIRQRNPKSIPQCRSCKVKDNCGGGCAGLAYYSSGDYLGIVPGFCKAVRYLAERIPLNKGYLEHLHP